MPNHINNACTFPSTANNSLLLITGMLIYYVRNISCILNSCHCGPNTCFYCYVDNGYSVNDIIKTEIQKDSK